MYYSEGNTIFLNLNRSFNSKIYILIDYIVRQTIICVPQ